MHLTVVTGGANSGKTRFLYETVVRAVDAGECPTVVVPTFPDAVRVETEFADKDIAGVRVSAFDRWLAELWLLHGDGRALVAHLERRVLMARAIDGTALTEHAAVATEAGFRDVLCDVASQLEPEVAASVARCGGGDREIATLLARYADVCEEQGMIEPLGAAAMLAEGAPTLDGPVVANRFTTLSGIQERLLAGLARRNSVTVALTWEHGHPATEATEPLVTRLTEGGARHVVASEGTGTEVELASIERQLYRPGAAIEATGAVSFAAAADEVAEAELIGDVVSSWIAAGMQPDRIAVAFRDPSRRHHALHRLVEHAGVDIHLDILIPFSRSGYGAALLALLDCVSASAANRSRLLAFLATPYSGSEPTSVAAADMRWRRDRVEGQTLLDAVSALGGAAARAVAIARSLVRDPVTVQTADRWQELADILIASARAEHPPGTEEGLLDLAAHSVVCEAVTSALELRRPDVTAAEVTEAIRGAKVGPVPAPSPESVVVTEAKRLQGRRFDAVVIGGLSRSEFSPVKTHSVSRFLAERLGALASPDEALLERLIFYSVVTRARARLVLVHPSTLSGSEGDVPSPFVDEILDLYRTETERESGVPPRRGPANLRPPTRESAHEYVPASARVSSAPCVAGSDCDTAQEQRFRADLIRAQREREEFSVTEIETYLACPRSWLIVYGVKARDADSQLGASELGSHAHTLLAGFYEEWRKRGRARVTSDTIEEALEVLAQVEEGLSAHARMHPQNLEERFAVAAVHERARALVRDDATFLPGFEPAEHEFAFGAASGRPFVFGGVRLAGKIDRIDTSSDSLVVMDYKSGSTIAGHRRFAGDGLVQLPVYAAAAATNLGRQAVGAVYRSIASLQVRGAWVAASADLGAQGVSTDSVDPSAFSALIDDAQDRVAVAVHGMRAGQVDPAPRGERACRYCPITGVCGEATPSWEPN